ncbi:MAG: helix-turn-helix domain-containing protein [Methylococcaceae bacterium]|jgi:transcriptional regulator with XRE-family HTH domain|uniref:helix-turn-helix domain-containing protein n=1 Tax=Methylobacter psychrophilus TaxID=96941 RepID=UPI0021D4D05D|nr:helix-turn-helix transcriptional regulator [Methylobacter psychrophilus]
MEALQDYLIKKGMSQAEFGRLVGVGQTMVQQWVSSKRPISIVKALDIEEVFGIDANLLNEEISVIENRLLDRRTSKRRGISKSS